MLSNPVNLTHSDWVRTMVAAFFDSAAKQEGLDLSNMTDEDWHGAFASLDLPAELYDVAMQVVHAKTLALKGSR